MRITKQQLKQIIMEEIDSKTKITENSIVSETLHSLETTSDMVMSLDEEQLNEILPALIPMITKALANPAVLKMIMGALTGGGK
tara:strand:- start:127 stop:378 length:252 start_codon:yes stop_codon:yes gene_type:complete